MNHDQLVATLKQVSTATLTMQLLKRGLRQVWMYGPKPLADGQDRIAGPAFTDVEDAERTRGGTGFGVRLLVDLATCFTA